MTTTSLQSSTTHRLGAAVGAGTVLPVRIALVDGEGLDGYLERLAAANHLTHPALLHLLTDRAGDIDGAGGSTSAAFLPIKPARQLLRAVSHATGIATDDLQAATLADSAGLDLAQLDPTDPSSLRTVAARGWAPGRGSEICPTCLAADGVWRIAWRHPWVATCLDHGCWLHHTCPACRLPFRSQRHPLRSVDAEDHTCGNPQGRRGKSCHRDLAALPTETAPEEVLCSQHRIRDAISGAPVPVHGQTLDGSDYLTELKNLAVLLLHLGVQPGAEALATWTVAAREDQARSRGDRTARWGLAPPADPRLRGSALAVADRILAAPDLEEAADRLHPWTDLTPDTSDGQLGWLADHTTMTASLSRLVMAATATRRRVGTLLDQPTAVPIRAETIPQALPAETYRRHLDGLLDVTDTTGRLYASLCLARRHGPRPSWAVAACVLGLPEGVGVTTARACSARLLASPARLVTALDQIVDALDPTADYRAREDAVRGLASRRRWYARWARAYYPGSRATSRPYAIAWLWTTYAHGHLAFSPGWSSPPDHRVRGYHRRYADRLPPAAKTALLDLLTENRTLPSSARRST